MAVRDFCRLCEVKIYASTVQSVSTSRLSARPLFVDWPGCFQAGGKRKAMTLSQTEYGSEMKLSGSTKSDVVRLRKHQNASKMTITLIT